MASKEDTFQERFIKKIYENKNYNDYYGESLIITILVLIIVVYAVVSNSILLGCSLTGIQASL